MDATAERKCAHPNCNCGVSGDQQYCSTACEQSAASAQSASGSEQDKCGCNHSECRLAA